jgi:alginate production protein
MMKTVCCVLCVLMSVFQCLAQEQDSEDLDSDVLSEGIVEKPFEMDSDEYHVVSLFDKSLYLKGELQFAVEFRGDHELDSSAKDDVLEIEPALNLELFCPVTDWFSIYLEGEMQYKYEELTESNRDFRKWIVERSESWVYFGHLEEGGFGLQIGRQNYEDARQWWWDEKLDSIRLLYDSPVFHVEGAIAQELGRESNEEDRMDPEDQDIFRFLSHAAWSRDESFRVDLFGLLQNDHSSQPRQDDLIKPYLEDEMDADLTWFGVRFSGELDLGKAGELAYWADVAGLRGDETLFEFEETEEDLSEVSDVFTRDVSAWGMDTGIEWNTGRLSDMTLTLGYAAGSGDRTPETGRNTAFRQTGFNEGDKRFQYYGELLNPDLSNLRIFTAALGFNVMEDSTIDVIYHRYDQAYPADFMWESDLEADPEGLDGSVGEEWDAVLNIEMWEHFEIEFSGALFRAGDAFGSLSGETAYRLKFEINYLF